MTFFRALALTGLALSCVACEAPVSLGADCTRASECSGSLVCQFGRCRTECVQNRDCPVGATCLPDGEGGVCSVEVDLGCETGVGRMCPSGLTCLSDRFVATCTSAAECPADGECRASPVPGVSFCFDPRLPVLDAGGLDASTDDGGSLDAGSMDVGIEAAQRDAAPTPPGVTSVCIEANDDERACAVRDGQVFCWGHDADGGLGDGPTLGRVGVPAAVVYGDGTPLTGFRQVTCGYDHACALRDDGAIFCWGVDMSMRGTLGAPDMLDHAEPIVLAAGTIDAIAAGQYHTCAHYESGLVRCWGANAQGQIDPMPAGYTADPSPDPGSWRADFDVAPFGLSPYALVRAARLRTCVVDLTTPSMRCTGLAEFAVAGTVGPPSVADGSVSVSLPAGTSDLALGRGHACVVDASGIVSCMGGQTYDALGTGGTTLVDCAGEDCTPTPLPITVAASVLFDGVASGPGSDHTCATVASPGRGLYCWGLSDLGQCGTTSATILPTAVPSMSTVHVTQVATSHTTTCAIDDAGVLYCWGGNRSGQLGRDGLDPGAHPAAVPVTFPSSP